MTDISTQDCVSTCFSIKKYNKKHVFFCMEIGFGKQYYLNFTINPALAGAGINGGAIQYCLVEIRNKTQHGYEVLQDLTKVI